MNTQIPQLEPARLFLIPNFHTRKITHTPFTFLNKGSPFPLQAPPTPHPIQPHNGRLLTKNRLLLNSIHIHNPKTLQEHSPSPSLLRLDPVDKVAEPLFGLVKADPREVHPDPALVVIEFGWEVHCQIEFDLVNWFEVVVVGVGFSAL